MKRFVKGALVLWQLAGVTAALWAVATIAGNPPPDVGTDFAILGLGGIVSVAISQGFINAIR